ncbi:unnamed protein product, partial [marine sediment metagenome]
NPSAVLVTLSADHVIRPAAAFRRNAAAAVGAARAADCLVTIGIRPTGPETRFGYIERGKKLSVLRGQNVYQVKRFKEKPHAAAARRYVKNPRYYWNAGIFFWRAEVILDQFRRFLPDHYAKLRRIAAALGTSRQGRVTKRVYPTFKRISIDYGVMEKADDVRVVESTFGWDDVGGFPALAPYLKTDHNGNFVDGRHVGLDSSGNVIVSGGGHTIATVGVNDMVIVHTPDVTLVVPAEKASEVKSLVRKLKKSRWSDLT